MDKALNNAQTHEKYSPARYASGACRVLLDDCVALTRTTPPPTRKAAVATVSERVEKQWGGSREGFVFQTSRKMC